MARKTRRAGDKAHYPEQSVMSVGMAARCPRCGEGRLYKSLLVPVDRCAMCGLDMSFAEEGDGPAVLVILLLGGVVAGLALAFETLFHPPVWLHVLVWLPVTFGLSIYALRAMKGIMIASQFKTRAAEGQLDIEDEA
ncbi:DUF983 domain-containing protein [Salaquimonas pukyongi]|uniref:DUF983 domain-containing protein n=1 Tax=Salaquimonas pukyongi TaxID=2712698 RepID=UPI00096B6BCC|nr:DUF983 domain-containing protein [Salaquimonas pukyongi]